MAVAANQATAWVFLVVAGLLEIAWAIGMKYSEGFTKLLPSIVTIVAPGLASGSWPLR
jgi:quaternary ammonium compound-resistance protein SugE